MALKGLRSDTALNGAVGVVTGYDRKRARYFVDLSLQRMEVNVRACNLRPLPTKAGIVQDITISQGISNSNVVRNVGVVVHTTDCTSLSSEGGTADVLKQFPFAAPFKGRVAARIQTLGLLRLPTKRLALGLDLRSCFLQRTMRTRCWGSRKRELFAPRWLSS